MHPSLNKQALNNAISNARSTVNSWFNNLNSISSQAKTVSSSWNNWLIATVAGSSKSSSNSQVARIDNKVNDDLVKPKNDDCDNQNVNETSF